MALERQTSKILGKWNKCHTSFSFELSNLYVFIWKLRVSCNSRHMLKKVHYLIVGCQGH
jgi:hypothetical protein